MGTESMFASAMAVTTFVAPGPEVTMHTPSLASGQCVAFCRMSGGLLVTHQHEAELRVVFDLVVDGQNRAARNAEDVLDAEVLQRTNQRLGASHLLAIDDGLLIRGPC